jgi:hypothetical protein
MSLMELLQTIERVAQTGGTPAQCEALAREVEAMADMVGWAHGRIDADGRLLDRLAAMQDDLQRRQAQIQSNSLVLLHDTLTDLGRAIAQHDDDFDSDQDIEEEGEDFA